jgi:O-antigen/teichoic acid export membrane protein
MSTGPLPQRPTAALHQATTGILGRDSVRRILANSGWLVVDKAVRALLGVAVGAWVARHLGPSDFGQLAYVLTIVAMLQVLASAGTDLIVVREIARTPTAASEVLGSTLALRSGCGLASWLAAVVGMAALTSNDRSLVALTAVIGCTLVFQAADVVDLWFQSQSQSRRTVSAKLLVAVGSAAIKIALIVNNATLMAFALVAAVESGLSALALWLAYRQFRFRGGGWTRSLKMINRLVYESWPLMLSGLLAWVYQRIDQLLIKQLIGSHDLGVYAAVLPISQVWQIIPMALAVSLAPFLTRLRTEDPRRHEAIIVLIFRVLFYCGLLTSVLTWAMADFLVHFLLGDDYAGGSDVVAVHAVSNAFCFLGVAHTLWLTGTKRWTVRLYGAALASATSVLLNAWLLPSWGLMGAAWAAIASQFAAAVLINVAMDRQVLRMQLRAIIFRGPC